MSPLFSAQGDAKMFFLSCGPQPSPGRASFYNAVNVAVSAVLVLQSYGWKFSSLSGHFSQFADENVSILLVQEGAFYDYTTDCGLRTHFRTSIYNPSRNPKLHD